MELRRTFKILLRWWWLVALPVAVVLGYVALTYAPPPVQHQVVLRFAAGTEPAGLSVDYDRYYPWLTSEYVANGLADIARTDAFARAVAARLATEGTEISPAALQGAIASDNVQSIFVLYLTWPEPETLVALSEAVTLELTTNAVAYFPQLSGLGRVARRLDEPVPHPLAPSLRAQLLGPALRLLLAGGVGLALVFLAHYFDPYVREPEELDSLGLPVIGLLTR